MIQGLHRQFENEIAIVQFRRHRKKESKTDRRETRRNKDGDVRKTRLVSDRDERGNTNERFAEYLRHRQFGLFTEKVRLHLNRWIDPTTERQVRLILYQDQFGPENLLIH